MGTDTVLSTPDSIAAAKGMLETINNESTGIVAALNKFKSHGEIINNPAYFEGTAASGFRSEWPGVKSALDNAVAAINALADNVRAVNSNIQQAGGNTAS